MTAGPKYQRQIVPDPAYVRMVDGRPKHYAQDICEQVIAGRTQQQVADWLEAEHVKPAGIVMERKDGRGHSGRWWATSVGQIIRNTTYCGYKTDDGTSTGKIVHECEPVVPPDIWARANKALDGLAVRGPIDVEGAALLSALLRCWPCSARGIDSPMYRIKTKGGIQYRCTGRGPRRKGCGLLLPLADADALVDTMMGQSDRPVTRRVLVPGSDPAALERIKFEIRRLPLADLSDDEHDRKLKELRAERDRLTAAGATPERWVEQPTGQSYGQAWRSMTPAERRSWLRSAVADAQFHLYGGRPAELTAEAAAAPQGDEQAEAQLGVIISNERAAIMFVS